MAAPEGAETELEAPTAEEIAADPQYEQVGAQESAGEQVATGVASPPVSPAEDAS
jgi:hypothetical protein